MNRTHGAGEFAASFTMLLATFTTNAQEVVVEFSPPATSNLKI